MRLVTSVVIEDDIAAACFDVMKDIQGRMNIVQDIDGKINEQNYMLSFAYLLGSKLRDTGALYGGELKKIIDCSDTKVKELIARVRTNCTEYNQPDVTVKPDFVIHNSIEPVDLNMSTQQLVIEAKTTNQLSQDCFSWDLYKLSAYINQLAYRTGIYIIVNENKEKIDDYIEGYIHQKLPTINISGGHMLYFFIQEKDCSAPKVYRFV